MKWKLWIRRLLSVIQLLLLLPIGWFAWHLFGPRHYSSPEAETLSIPLSTGPFDILYYAAKYPRGVLLVATGDGGWSNQWEEPVARHAAAAGYAVGGWDCRKFANARGIFDQEKLTEAFHEAVSAVRMRAKLPADCPVWYTGWSTGAEWALAAAAVPNRIPQLRGVLPAAPGKRSRYGITAADLMGKEPQGEGSFPLTSLAPGLAGLTLVQFAAELDPLDDVEWLKSLHPATPRKLVPIPGAPHDMNGAGPRFLTEFDMAMQWIEDHPAPRP